jgi:hypothetical protein
VALVGLSLSATGCGYLKNLRDDALDCGTFAVGIVPPVVPTAEGPKVVGFLPPAIGAYVQVTDFFHLGALFKATGDAEWDRRGLGLTVDRRTELGLGPIHHVYIEQTPIAANDYKTTANELDGWRAHMDKLTDPVFGAPAKTLIYVPVEDTVTGCKSLPYLPRGWQDWETISVELAVPEPFILHTGFYVRAGVDVSQVFDLVLSVFCIDLYGDAAYECWSGEPKYPLGRE